LLRILLQREKLLYFLWKKKQILALLFLVLWVLSSLATYYFEGRYYEVVTSLRLRGKTFGSLLQSKSITKNNLTNFSEQENILLQDICKSELWQDSLFLFKYLPGMYEEGNPLESIATFRQNSLVECVDKKDVEVKICVRDLSSEKALEIRNAIKNRITETFLNEFRSGLKILIKKQDEMLSHAEEQKAILAQRPILKSPEANGIFSLPQDSLITLTSFESKIRSGKLSSVELVELTGIISRLQEINSLIQEAYSDLFFLRSALKLSGDDLLYESNRFSQGNKKYTLFENIYNGGKYLLSVLLILFMLFLLISSLFSESIEKLILMNTGEKGKIQGS